MNYVLYQNFIKKNKCLKFPWKLRLTPLARAEGGVASGRQFLGQYRGKGGAGTGSVGVASHMQTCVI